MLDINCSYGEGGGQLVRSAVALSAVTGIPIKLTGIRANRPKPGLASQHITAIKAVAKLCNGNHSELQLGTTTLKFESGKVMSGKFEFDIGTAGSITLVLQACLLPALFGELKGELAIKVRGGTDVRWSPPFDYFSCVFLKHLRLLGIKAEAKLINRGYYPEGGGEGGLKITAGGNYKKLDITTRGKIIDISGIIHSRKLPSHVSRRMLEAAKSKLKNYSPINLQLDEGLQSKSTGTGLVLLANYKRSVLGASALGSKGIPAERVGSDAAEALITELEGSGAVDIYAADQLVPILALMGGELTVRSLSSHTKTNLWLTEQFLNKKFCVEEQKKSVKISY